MTKRLAVIGYPLGHTLSPKIHGSAIRALGLDLRYDAVETAPERLPTFLEELRGPEWLGCNVTVPHKQAVLCALGEQSEEARAIGAVNTIANRDGRLAGFNTDARGFLADLEEHFGPVAGKRVLLLGAGGAARAVGFALRDAAERVWVLNRSQERAERLVADLGGSLQLGRAAHIKEAELVINCTSAGLHEGDTPLPEDHIPEGIALYDLIYNPRVTRLMQAVIERGGRAVNGLGMLVRQAALAFQIWTGVEPPLDVMFEAANA
ncbi:MAG TPA: shikimate dehydrogenase [Chloroflexota bacterium]|nr:shikimate dehydrogenase [Chloroflexota bacterium]